MGKIKRINVHSILKSEAMLNEFRSRLQYAGNDSECICLTKTRYASKASVAPTTFAGIWVARIAWEMAHKRSLPMNQRIKMTCGNAWCCNTEHMTLVPNPHKKARLSPAQVEDIRDRVARGEPYFLIAQAYDLAVSVVWSLANYRTYYSPDDSEGEEM